MQKVPTKAQSPPQFSPRGIPPHSWRSEDETVSQLKSERRGEGAP